MADTGAKTYVALMFFTMKDSWFELSPQQRQGLTRDHVGVLSKFTDKVAMTHLAGTGLSKFDLVEMLEADNLATINDMIGRFKEGKKARYGELRDVMIMEKGLGKLAAG